MDGRAIDFRLLECLQVLVAERHVTRAAERIGMTQPKLSSALARLRQLTGDPLLVRTPEGMMPTDLALELAAHSGEFLLRWRGLVSSDSNFSPATADRTFRIQTTDFVLQDLIVPLMAEARALAPGVRISVTSPSHDLREQLETGEIDLVIGYVPHAPEDLFITQLLDYTPCCIAAGAHPRLGDTLDFDQYVAEAHVIITFGRSHQPFMTEQFVNSLLAEHNAKRNVAAYVPSALVVPDMVASSDLLAMVPRPLAEAAAERLALKVFDPPFSIPPQDIAMIWHARTKNDPPARWLRGLLRKVAHGKSRTSGQPLIEVA